MTEYLRAKEWYFCSGKGTAAFLPQTKNSARCNPLDFLRRTYVNEQFIKNSIQWKE